MSCSRGRPFVQRTTAMLKQSECLTRRYIGGISFFFFTRQWFPL